MIQKEIWKNISGYKSKYQISNLGNVKSVNYNRTGKEKILKTTQNNKGYLGVILCNGDGKRKYRYVHRLVAEAFIPNPLNLPQVNHKKEFEKWNNKVENLEWVTAKENVNYGTRTQRESKKVFQYSKEGILIKEWKSTNDCKRNGFNQSHVWECCIGNRKLYKGFAWSYIGERSC